MYMKEELNLKIDKLIEVLDNDSRFQKLVSIKEKLLNDSEILAKIDKLKELDIYSNEYKSLKKELFEDKDFVAYKELENEIDFLILEINKKLRVLTDERRCNHANN